MLNIGINSYVTLQEAEDYVDDYYSEFDNLACHWRVLSSHKKIILLRQSAAEIDNQILQGKIFCKDQSMQFPRKCCYKEGPTIPDEVKSAQIENALGIFRASLASRSDEQMKILQTLGAMRNPKYDKRQMGEVGLGASLIGGQGASIIKTQHLTSLSAEEMLKAWL